MITVEEAKGLKKNYDDVNVEPIVFDVKENGDKALIELTKKFDKVDITEFKVSDKEIKEAYSKINEETIAAIKESASNVRVYSELQMPKPWTKEVKPGIEVGQKVIPLEKVGCYVPAGQYPLPSTVLMTVVPAKVAGVKEIIVVTPPKLSPEILVAADIAGASAVYRVGGAQAIAALAYGTESIPKVDKIVGPGNVYVTAAKKLVYGDVGIDFLAGPSEIMIYSDNGSSSLIAGDMLGQAEHDKLASAIFVTTNKELAVDVEKEINEQLSKLSTKDIASEALKEVVLASSIEKGFDFINSMAPEHLEVENEEQVSLVKNAGAIFVGEYSCESAGDYSVGPSHVLPTAGVAKFRAGLSVMDFVKMPSVQKLTKEGLNSIKDSIITLAAAEGLEAHKKAVEKRFEDG